MSKFNTSAVRIYAAENFMTEDRGGGVCHPPKPKSNALPPPPPDVVAQALNVRSLTIEWLAGDGSDRCYYRITSPDLPSSLVLMQLSGTDADALKANGYDWINIAKIMENRGIFVPRVIATMPDHAALVIEDYGNAMLESVVYRIATRENFEEVQALYQSCFEILAKMLNIPRDNEAPWCKRSFDTERFVWELNFFQQKYLANAAGISLSPAQAKQFGLDIQAVSDFLAADSRWFVHRDFHSRNVMVQNGTMAVIDFQDARLGPAAYDLISLCFDSYVPFTAESRSRLFESGKECIGKKSGRDAVHQIELRWKPVLLQRQLKAIGSFGFLTFDKKRGNYLKYVDPALRTLEEQDLFDERWPFLSGELLRLMRSKISDTAHGA